jgi:hypothetical protein
MSGLSNCAVIGTVPWRRRITLHRVSFHIWRTGEGLLDRFVRS